MCMYEVTLLTVLYHTHKMQKNNNIPSCTMNIIFDCNLSLLKISTITIIIIVIISKLKICGKKWWNCSSGLSFFILFYVHSCQFNLMVTTILFTTMIFGIINNNFSSYFPPIVASFPPQPPHTQSIPYINMWIYLLHCTHIFIFHSYRFSHSLSRTVSLSCLCCQFCIMK